MTLSTSDDETWMEPRNVRSTSKIGKPKKTESCSTECDILLLSDTATGKTAIEVGTDNTDDYCQSFVSCFSPENMATTTRRHT